MPQDTPAILNAIHVLKAEILSPDWTLSPRRNANISDAMETLNLFFRERRYTKGLVAIAKQLLCHLSHDSDIKRGAIDFLKEIMAHIVTIYEQDEDEGREKKVCVSCLKRFKKMAIPIKVTTNPTNKFALANSSLKHDVDQLQSLAPHFNTLSPTKQIQAMLTLQSLIAETKALQKIMAPPT